MRDEFAPAPVDGPPSVALSGTPVLDAAGPGVVVETDEFGSYWESVDEVIREASVARMEVIVEKAERLGDEVGGQQRSGIFQFFATIGAFLTSPFAPAQERELATALQSLRENLATAREAAQGRKANAWLDLALAWLAHEWHMSRREALDSVHQGLTRRQSDLAALRSTLERKVEAAQDGGMSSEAREQLEPIRAGLTAIADDIGVEVDNLGSDTWSDLRTMAVRTADALMARLDVTRARKDELGETAPSLMDVAKAKDLWEAAQGELKVLQNADISVMELEKEARLITSMSTDGHVTAQRDEQAVSCSPDSWPSRDTVGFISVFARPTPEEIDREIRERVRHPGAYLLPLDVKAIEARPQSWRDALDDDAQRLVTYFNSEFGHEEIRRVVDRGAIVVHIPLSISTDLAAFREDLWKALKVLSAWNGEHVDLLDALKAIGYVHHRQDPAEEHRGRYFVYSPRLVVTYAGGKRAEDIYTEVKDFSLESRLFAIARGEADAQEAYPRWVEVVDWLIDDARSAGGPRVESLMDLQNLTKAPDVLGVAKPSFQTLEKTEKVQGSPPSDSTPAPTCTDYDVTGNFDDPRAQLTQLICDNIVETGWPSWRFD